MIFGIGTDIAKVSRFERWVKDDAMIARFFHDAERFSGTCTVHTAAACQHYAARFAAKEAFAKALGTGFVGLTLNDFGVVHDENGAPFFVFGQKTKQLLEKKAGASRVLLSLSHEKEYAIAVVVIETA